jgi:membrane complex biogenesis BtpA family protein
VSVPFGIDLMWDPAASLAVAVATGASFVRGVLMGAYESDVGMLDPSAADLFDLRHDLGADAIALFHNVTPEFAAPLSGRPVGERARSAAYLGVDALLLSGPAAGREVRREDLDTVRQAVPKVPVLVNTGVTEHTVADYLQVADGVIVGTNLKRNGDTWAPVDAARVRRLMRAVKTKVSGAEAPPG